MLSKDVATVRVSNVGRDVQKAEIRDFFEKHKLTPTNGISLCPRSASGVDSQVATVTFKSCSEAKRALTLNGKTLRGSTLEIDRDFMGFTVLARPDNPSFDLIAIHGLNGHAYGTWCSHESDTGNGEAMWLRDFLPEKFEQARVISYGYSSTLMGPNATVSGVKDFAYDLLQRLLDDRITDKANPRHIIFICHSLGGIVAKQAFVLAHAYNDRYPGISDAIQAVLFLATPHGGSRSANIGSLLARVATLAFQTPSTQLLDSLKYDSKVLYQLSVDFKAINSTLKVVSFYERRKTPGLNSLVVDEESSRLGVDGEVLIPIEATHSGISKFNGPSDARFLPVLAQIQRCCIDFSVPDYTTVEASALSRDVSSLLPSAKGHFSVPIYRNPQFFGRREQLGILEKYLDIDEKRGYPRYPIVAVHGLGGIGKTQLVTEYVYQRRAKLPNKSIFWIRATSESEIESQFQEIAKTLGTVQETTEPGHAVTAPNMQRLYLGVESVKDWLCLPKHHGWLIVFDNYDNISVDIRRFIPAEPIGSILITTRDRRVIGSVASHGIWLTTMSSYDAECLFVRTQRGISGEFWTDPESHPEYKTIKQIVEELHCFPLAITQATGFIRENSPMTFQEYLGYLAPRSADRELLMRFQEVNPNYPQSVMTTWEISMLYLREKQPRACWILQLLGFLDCSSIPEDLLTAATKVTCWNFASTTYKRHVPTTFRADLAYLEDDVGFRVAIGTLTSLSLVNRQVSYHDGKVQATLSMHPLVHEWIRVRLNSNPIEQAKTTIAAALVLYQNFPGEVVVGLFDQAPPISRDLYLRFDSVITHIRCLLLNLQDYHSAAVSTPLECFTLCEVIFLAGCRKHSLYDRHISAGMLQMLDKTIKCILSRLKEAVSPLASFIHKVVVWLQQRHSPRECLSSSTGITKSLKSLSLPIELDDSTAMFVMLVITAITDVSDYINESEYPTPVEKDFNRPQEVRERKKLFHYTYKVLSTSLSVSPLIQRMILFVKYRLLVLMTPDMYANYRGFNIVQDLFPNALAHLSNPQKCEYMCLIARLLWEHNKYKDWPAIKQFFTFALEEFQAMLSESQRELRRRQDQKLLQAWSYSSYISSAFGRQTGFDNIKSSEDLVTPLDYIWSITLPVAETISNPQTRWKVQDGNVPPYTHIDRSERNFAIKLVSSMERIYQVAKDNFSGQSVNTLALNHFSAWAVKSSMIKIYSNLDDWSAMDIIWEALQCPLLLPLTEPRPWASESTADARQISDLISNASKVKSETFPTSVRNIPEALQYVKSNTIDDVIVAFIKLYQHRCKPAATEIDEFYMLFGVIKDLPTPMPGHLARLELIYRIAKCCLGNECFNTVGKTNLVPFPEGEAEFSDSDSLPDSVSGVLEKANNTGEMVFDMAFD